MKTMFVMLQTVVLLSLSLSFVSCDRDRDILDNAPISEEEIVALIEGALQARSEGVAAESADAAYVAETYTEKTLTMECGQTLDSTVVRSLSNNQITANYSWVWNWTLNCDQLGLPSSIDMTAEAAGSYQTSRMESNDVTTADLSIGNLLLGQYYTISGTFSRTGNQTSRIRNGNSFSSNLVIEVDDFAVDKGTRRLSSGNADFTLTGEGTGGESFTFEGDIIINGDGTATLVINGDQYTIPLF